MKPKILFIHIGNDTEYTLPEVDNTHYESVFVYVNCRNKNDSVEDLLKEISEAGGDASVLEFDVTDTSQITESLKNFQHDALDILINNAGTLRDNLIPQIELDDWNTVLNTNFFGSLNVYNAFYEKLRNAECASVVNMASISGLRPRKGQLAYAVSKSMLIEWTKTMALKDENNIDYYAISPGPVATDHIKSSPWYKDKKGLKRIPFGCYAEVEEIAGLVSLLTTNNRCMQSGLNIVIDGGFIQTVKEQ